MRNPPSLTEPKTTTWGLSTYTSQRLWRRLPRCPSHRYRHLSHSAQLGPAECPLVSHNPPSPSPPPQAPFFFPSTLNSLLPRTSEIEDCTQPWTFPPSHFDYIHMRGLVGSIDDWPALFQQAYNCLKPGGWLESYEVSPIWESDDSEIPKDSALAQWGKIFVEGGKKFGRTFTVVGDKLQRKGMEESGFKGLNEFDIKVHAVAASFILLRKGYVRSDMPAK